MSSVDPFASNPNFTKLFSERSEVTRCDIQEVVELWKNTVNNYYVLFRYQCTNNTMPIRMTYKFSDLLGVETIDDGKNVSLFITTAYKDYLSLFQRFNICCGSKTYIIRVEKQLYHYLFQ